MNLMNWKYKKIVELPTGVRTEISDTLEGKIKVKCNTMEVFLEPIIDEL